MMEKPFPAFIISLIGGIFILLSSIYMYIFFMPFIVAEHYPSLSPFEGMMWGAMGIWAWGIYMGIVGIVCGIIIIVSALKLYNEPEKTQLWGTLVIIFSVISLLSMGGFLIGFLLGLIGGILAVVWKPGSAQ